MDPDDRSLPPFPERTPGPTTNATPSFSGVDANSSFRSNRRSRASRTSERESLEEEIRRTVKALRAQVDEERRRADNAERKVREVTAHLKTVNDARLEALRDSGRAKEELRLYKIQLDTAQKEIYRAQEVIGIVDKQRHTAEKEAATNRTRARQLNEKILIQTAREEAYRLGMKEGLDRGRALAYAEQPLTPYEGDEDYDDYFVDDSHTPSPHNSDLEPPRPRSMMAPSHNSRRSRADSRPHASPSPIPVPLPSDILPVNPPTGAQSVRAPSNYAPSVRPGSMRAPSPNPSNARPLSNYGPSMRAPSPNPSNAYPSSNYAPSVHAASPNSLNAHPSIINLSERMGRPTSVRSITPTPRHPAVAVPPDNLIPTLDADLRIRLPPPHELSARTPERGVSPTLPAMSESSQTSQDPLPVPPRSQSQPRTGRHRRTSSSGSSTALSQLELFSNPYAAGMRTPMSIIEEVNSQASPYNPDMSMSHQRSFSENSRQPAAPSNYGDDTQSMRRSQSRSSYAGSWMHPPAPAPPADDRRSQRSYNSDAPNISVQPPSLSNKTDSIYGGASQRGASPAPSQRSAHHAPPEGQYGSGMPGGYTGYYEPAAPQAETPVVPVAPLRYQPRHPALQSQNRQAGYRDDDAVSSALSADTLTTPPQMYRAEPESGAGW